jgi:hypothetical protein
VGIQKNKNTVNNEMSEEPTTAQLELNVETSSRRVVRSAAGIRAIGGGNLLIEPLAPYLAGRVGSTFRNVIFCVSKSFTKLDDSRYYDTRERVQP